jgi:tRNA threonylcarbamoyl adenosine modification protein YeaZ
MYLYINTTSSDLIVLALADKKGEVLKLKKIKASYQQSEKLLSEIEKLLDYQIIKLSGVIVVSGPGGFTSLRIGVASANALAFSLQIPIVGVEYSNSQSDEGIIASGAKRLTKIKQFKQVLPKYGREPNINLKNNMGRKGKWTLV